jgi:Tfp pilus assembly PilM family ATPase
VRSKRPAAILQTHSGLAHETKKALISRGLMSDSFTAMFTAWPETSMAYYEKLVRNVNRSMKKYPRSAVAMDVDTFQLVAKAASLAALEKKLRSRLSGSTLIFQKPGRRPAWIF